MLFSSSSLHLALLAAAPLANAWPTAILDAAGHDPELLKRATEAARLMKGRQQGIGAVTAVFEPVPIFNARAQYVNVSRGSGHEYVAPGPNDLRGPCPGLNALANHNFLPHNGVATVTQYVEVTQRVVGMGVLLGTFLTVLAGALDGNILTWSMGGTPPGVLEGLLGGALNGNGLSGSHNKYETDASPTRPDLYQGGNNYKVVTSQFQELVDMSPGGITMESLTAFRNRRFDQQVSSNPYFFNGPFSGMLVQPAAYTFIYRFMANHSAEHPAGILSSEVLQSWFGVQGNSGNYKAIVGTERIPDNWFISIGGNTGKPNSFVGVNVGDLSGGVFSSGNMLEGNNLACFLYQTAAQAKPDLLLGALSALTNIVGNLMATLGCPELKAIDAEQLKQFPGYQRNPVYG
ncbi:Peroxidase-2 domain-containing protein [Pyrenophora tritici-repentis]|uniref:Peroxidase-2 domain containing protein n=1 Tax=Pyrenophora tritici-repentis TaxID=45151 RepID=A0A2W1GDN5_9PLEO|nr:Peroxidase-2 domain containing protein [Pyrenophora tritici-repentis]KAF7569856.1 Peroxidase-2 domain containing protein [Pyrenophora tritici-repentis]KAI0574693.1 Peroxidase-2 domain-containing protein [Pyrenophora tritici-repentis]KAI0579452.1 Peroxidase-2 domain-containing protein [Pyrenophora tritici-repentis]KAI0608187.1 Peroxidase-2 domain-containing protein [Pyrenophora tritici-repentis]